MPFRLSCQPDRTTSSGYRRFALAAVGFVAALGSYAATGTAQSVAVQAGAPDATSRLRHVDTLVTGAEAEVRERAARVGAVSDAGRRGAWGTLVVLLRADPSAPRTVEGATLTVDELQAEPRLYYAGDRDALGAGAVSELYRGAVLAVPHVLALAVAAGGRSVSQSVTVTPVADGRPTYVEFFVRGGSLDVASWLGGASSGVR